MMFLYPLGFLGLIGVPVLIIIYIIKNKYTEQTVTSTYLWTLSEKFLKKRLPINRLVGIISLILQIIAVIAVSFAIAHPVLAIANAADDYCFVIDGSGSMNVEYEDGTRFDYAKDEIAAVIEKSYNGSAFTLIFAGYTADVVFENVTDKDLALTLLDGVSAGNTASEVVDAMSAAQEFFNANPSVRTYLFTDRKVNGGDNVNVVTVCKETENCGLSDVIYKYETVVADNGEGEEIEKNVLTVTGKAVSYFKDTVLHVALYLDDAETTELIEEVAVITDEQTLERKAEFKFELEVDSFKKIRVVIEETDALALDNEVIIYNLYNEEDGNVCNTLLVSDRPFFIHAMLQSISDVPVKVTLKKAQDYRGESGYDLYIFDSYSPFSGWVLPDDGAVWFFNPVSDAAKTGFTVDPDPVELVTDISAEDYKEDTTLAVKLLENVNKNNFSVAKYRKIRLYRNFTTLLSANGNPLIFAGANEYGNRQVVFAFDLHDAPYMLLTDYIALSANLLNYIYPTVIESSNFVCGETVAVNVISNCDSLRVTSPNGKTNYYDGSNAVCEIALTEVGTYTLTLVLNDRSTKEFKFYSAFPEQERATGLQPAAFEITGTAGTEKRDGVYDDLIALFIVFALLFAAEWMVYCYEQYQLR